MARPQASVPQLPSELCSILDKIEPEVTVTLSRRGGGSGGGGRQYEEVDSWAASPSAAMRVRDVAERVTASVESDGNAYFAIQAFDDDDRPGTARFSWYAFAADASQPTAGDNDGMSHIEIVLMRTTDTLARFLTLFPAMGEAALKMMESNRQQSEMLIGTMNDHMSAQQETLIGIAQEERKADREKEGFKLLGQWLETRNDERDGVHAVHVGLAARLTPEDFDTLREHEAGKELLTTTTVEGLRTAAAQLIEAVKSGSLSISAESLSRVVPWMEKLAKTEVGSANGN